MLAELTKRICTVMVTGLLGAAVPCSASGAESAKGTNLGARESDGRKHFTLSADATWQLDVSERFDASALVFHHGKLLTINDRDAGFFEIPPNRQKMSRSPRSILDPPL